MPHVAGHVKNSILRKGQTFEKEVGIILPLCTRKLKTKNWAGDTIVIEPGLVDFPIMFVNDYPTPLVYGQQVRFLLHHIAIVKETHLIFGYQVLDFIAHEKAHKQLLIGAPPIGSAAAILEAQELAYKATVDYDIIFTKNNINQDDSDSVIEWLLNHAVAFDDMNLATN